MADALIETVTSNPYESIVADTSTQITDLDTQIQELSDAIANLEEKYPTSTTLPQLRERLLKLQSKRESLNTTNDSAKSLMDAYNVWQQNYNTLKWIYDVKQEEIRKEKQEAENAYKAMYDETKRSNENYMNALANANASEAAIINANAWRDWASAQSTAEARARNYLQNAQAQAEAANTARQNLNAIEENRLNSRAWYTQLSQANADNYLRQQILSDMELAEAERNRQAQYWSSYGWGWSSRWTSSRWTSNIFDPYTLNRDKNNNNNNNNDDKDNSDYKPKTLTMDELKKITHEKLDPLRHSADYYDNNYEYQKSLLEEEKNVLIEQAKNWTLPLDKYNADMNKLNSQEKLLEERWKYENKAKKQQDNADKLKQNYIDAVANDIWYETNPNNYLKWYNKHSNLSSEHQKKANEAKTTYLNSRKK